MSGQDNTARPSVDHGIPASFPSDEKVSPTNTQVGEAGEIDSLPIHAPPSRVPFFRSTIFQIIVVGGVFFCAPGMYNALSSLGAGGLASPWYVNATNAAGYAFMAAFCVFGGVIVSWIGVRWSLLGSSFGDLIYAISLYINSKNGTQWFLLFGSILSGCCDGLLYCVEGPVITAYPEPDRRGRMLALWVFMRSAGPVIGGAIIFGLNHSADSTGAVSLTTYLVIIGIMCAGPFIALLISPPSKVVRKDGRPIKFRKITPMEATKGWWRSVMSPQILLLCPLFFTSWFSGSYIGTLQTQYFTVRARSLTSLISPFGDILGGLVIGYFLDFKKLTRNQRAKYSFIFLMALNLGLWLWAAVITKQLRDDRPEIDWTSGRFGRTWALFLLFEFCTFATQTALYWIVGHMSDDMNELSYMTGTLRGVECAGQAVAYGVKSSDTNDWVSVGLNVGLIVLSIPTAWMVISKLAMVDPNEKGDDAEKGEGFEDVKQPERAFTEKSLDDKKGSFDY
ncbi:MFS general substrate transporter [Atractiella rhizophila]|nr:MFS general substrate transporter [Atractiella rhizophila]